MKIEKSIFIFLLTAFGAIGLCSSAKTGNYVLVGDSPYPNSSDMPSTISNDPTLVSRQDFYLMMKEDLANTEMRIGDLKARLGSLGAKDMADIESQSKDLEDRLNNLNHVGSEIKEIETGCRKARRSI